MAEENALEHRGLVNVLDVLDRTLIAAREYIASRGDRPVWPTVTLDELRAALGGPLPSDPVAPLHVIDALARAAEPGLVTTTGPRYFGFVTGGALPATVAAEWLAATWDQNTCLFVMSPAAAVVEEVAGAWLLDLLRLPASASVGFVTGCHMANFTALAAARHEVLQREGWDVEADGFQGAPRLRVIVGDEVHVSVIGALRLIGVGSQQVVRVAADDQGRMMPDALRAALASGDVRSGRVSLRDVPLRQASSKLLTAGSAVYGNCRHASVRFVTGGRRRRRTSIGRRIRSSARRAQLWGDARLRQTTQNAQNTRRTVFSCVFRPSTSSGRPEPVEGRGLCVPRRGYHAIIHREDGR